MKGVTFGAYHSYNNLHLILESKEIGSPAVKTKKLDIEGADGSLDLTDFFGEPKYEDVTHKLKFSTIVPQSEFLSLFSSVKNAIHGKRQRIIFDDDPLFFYIGRCHVSAFTNEKSIGIVAVECECEPYKYKSTITRERIILYGKNMADPANFEQGIINTTLGAKFEDLKANSDQRLRSKKVIYVKPLTAYTWTIPDGLLVAVRVFDADEALISYTGWRTGFAALTTNAIADSIAFFIMREAGGAISAADILNTNIMLEEGGRATEFEAFLTDVSVPVRLQNLKKRVTPMIKASGNVVIQKGGVSLALNYSSGVSPEIEFSEGANDLTVTGGGAVVFEYQERGL